MKTTREFCPASRYTYDGGLCSSGNGFAQVDTSQDAEYFGTWANASKLIIFTYCEGDCITQECETPEEFNAEMRRIKQWNEDNGIKFKGIDPMGKDDIKNAFVTVGLADLLH